MRLARIALSILILSGLSARSSPADTVVFPGPAGDGKPVQLSAVFLKPNGGGPFPAIVLLHGCYGITQNTHDWAARFVQWGYAALLVDSLAPRGVGQVCDAHGRVGFETRADDAHAAKTYLAGRPDVDRKRIFIVGWSHGGISVITALGDRSPGGRGDPFRAAVAFYPYCGPNLATVNAPLLVLIGEKDDWCPAEKCLANRPEKETGREVVVKVYPDAYHGFDRKGLDMDYQGHRLVYNAQAAADAAVRVKGFLDKYSKASLLDRPAE